MKLRLNPIVKKDLQVTARSMRLSWGLFAYEAVLTMIFLLALALIEMANDSIYSDGNIYSSFIYLFPSLAAAQICIIGLIVPIITASSISGEKERQTFDIMLTTCMSPFSIVFGKVVSAVLRILFFVVAGMPVMALAFVVGGLGWINLFYFVLAVILFSVFSGSIGILCSSFCRKSITAVVLSFVFYFMIFFLTFLPALIRSLLDVYSAGESLLFLLFNPIVFFEEFFLLIMRGESAFGGEGFMFYRDDVGFVTYYLSQGKVWIFTSAICILGMSILFMLVAAWKVNPMNTYSYKRSKKKKGL